MTPNGSIRGRSSASTSRRARGLQAATACALLAAWTCGAGTTRNTEANTGVLVGTAAAFRTVPERSPLSPAPDLRRTLPLDVVADVSNRGYRVALPVAWCVLALDVLLVLFALAVPRHRVVVGRVIQQSAWLFGATAWMMGTVSCLFLGGLRWFLAGVLLAGVGVIPVGIYVGVVARPGGGLVESLTAMALATVGAWYVGRRLRRADAL